MHDWPNAPSPDPLNTLRHDVQAAGSLSLTAGDLAARFGIQRLTPNARAQIAADLEQVGLLSTPSFAEAERGDQVTLTATAEHAPTTPRRRLPLKWLVVAPFVLLLLLLLAAERSAVIPPTSPRSPRGRQPPASRPPRRRPWCPRPSRSTTPSRSVPRLGLGAAGKWIAAATLPHGNDDDDLRRQPRSTWCPERVPAARVGRCATGRYARGLGR